MSQTVQFVPFNFRKTFARTFLVSSCGLKKKYFMKRRLKTENLFDQCIFPFYVSRSSRMDSVTSPSSVEWGRQRSICSICSNGEQGVSFVSRYLQKSFLAFVAADQTCFGHVDNVNVVIDNIQVSLDAFVIIQESDEL